MTRSLPPDLVDGRDESIGLLRDEVEALKVAELAVSADLRFEHLRHPDDEVWRFAALCWLDRKTNHVAAFVDEHGRKVLDLVCYIPVEHLSVESPVMACGTELVPLSDERLPSADPRWFPLDAPVGCCAAVPVSGTNHGHMADWAREQATHSLRLLRIALREWIGGNSRQLRFRLGISYAFDEQLSGWAQRDDVAYDLTYGAPLLKVVDGQPIAQLPQQPTCDIEKKANLAAKWVERAWLSGEPLVSLLYLFFALEALLGDKSEGLKAHGLAFRQAMLSHVAMGGFTHPNETWFLYDVVRSAAVHGEDVPEVSWEMVASFAHVVRRALNQYLQVAADQRITKRGRLLRFLDQHSDRPQLIAWFRTNGGRVWTYYLDAIEGNERTC